MTNYKSVNGALTELTEAETIALNAREAAWAVEKSNSVALNVRDQRNRLLAETDWMALSDITMSSEMTAYRQALRDVPAQAGFPASVTWPTKP